MIYFKKPFNFLNLGALAYLGGDSALTEVRFVEHVMALPVLRNAGQEARWRQLLLSMRCCCCDPRPSALGPYMPLREPLPNVLAAPPCSPLPQINLPFTNIKLQGQVRRWGRGHVVACAFCGAC